MSLAEMPAEHSKGLLFGLGTGICFENMKLKEKPQEEFGRSLGLGRRSPLPCVCSVICGGT